MACTPPGAQVSLRCAAAFPLPPGPAPSRRGRRANKTPFSPSEGLGSASGGVGGDCASESGIGSEGDSQPAAVRSRTWPSLRATLPRDCWVFTGSKMLPNSITWPYWEMERIPNSSFAVGCLKRKYLCPLNKFLNIVCRATCRHYFPELKTRVKGFFYERQCMFQLIV